MEEKKTIFTAKKIALLGVMTALAYGVSMLSFPIFPVAPFLKLDFSFAIMLLVGYMLGPIPATIMVVVVNMLGMIGSDGGIAGAIANTVMAGAYVIIPSALYKYKKGLKWVIAVLGGCILLQAILSLPMNRYVTFIIYQISNPANVFASLWVYILVFNLIKGVSNGIITILLYKRLKNLLHKFL